MSDSLPQSILIMLAFVGLCIILYHAVGYLWLFTAWLFGHGLKLYIKLFVKGKKGGW